MESQKFTCRHCSHAVHSRLVQTLQNQQRRHRCSSLMLPQRQAAAMETGACCCCCSCGCSRGHIPHCHCAIGGAAAHNVPLPAAVAAAGAWAAPAAAAGRLFQTAVCRAEYRAGMVLQFCRSCPLWQAVAGAQLALTCRQVAAQQC
jgi:hypothetical protein